MVVSGGEAAEVRRDARVCDGLNVFGRSDGFISTASATLRFVPLSMLLLRCQS